MLLLWTFSEPERLFQGHRLLYLWFALILKARYASVIHAGCPALCLPVLIVSRCLLPLFPPPFLLSLFFSSFALMLSSSIEHCVHSQWVVKLCSAGFKCKIVPAWKKFFFFFLLFIEMQFWKSSAPTNRKDHSLNSWLSHGFINFSLTILLDCIGHSYNVLVGSIMLCCLSLIKFWFSTRNTFMLYSDFQVQMCKVYWH